MMQALRLLFAVATGSLPPVLLFALLVLGDVAHWQPDVALLIWLASTAAVLVGGLPVFLLFSHLGRASWKTLAGAGFVLAALPVLLFSFPDPPAHGFSGGNFYGRFVYKHLDGQVTLDGWLVYLHGGLLYGLLGSLCALALLLAWRASMPRSQRRALPPV
ncbi:hypothetical protein [Chitinilyticum litopenaei]|uniref:hypothetical protein n=1 Tax=Chitinilyticum litopenaei TaxID=1121276 RepID=UPI0003F5E268|nr:hypothetical protein [Chitinilyticum litopenaei]